MGAGFRLIGVGWRLARQDALLPRELEATFPPALRLFARVLRGLTGPGPRSGRPGERLARALETLGPIAIKFGQLLSTRADIFGLAFAQDLARLKDQLAPFPMDQARHAVEHSLGRPLEALFQEFGPPVAAASLAQAHSAVLRDGRRVAVKILRPGVEAQVARDSEVLRLAGRLAETLLPLARRLEPLALVETVIAATELELDLRLEAAGGDELGEVMARDGYMSAPKIIWEGVGKRVLTLEWARGMALSDPAALAQPGLDRPALAGRLIQAFLAQALDHGVFHADLHEGNLFVSAPAQIEAVDFGIIGRLNPEGRRYLAEILWGFLERDYARVARVHFDAGYVPSHHDSAIFAQALRAVGEPVFGRSAQDVSMSRVLIQLFEITALFDMKLRPELVLLQKTMMTAEGVARHISPDLDIWAAADPVVRRWMLRELSPLSQVKRFADQAVSALRNLTALLEAEGRSPSSAMTAQAARPSPRTLIWAGLAGAALVTVILTLHLLG